MKTVMKLETKKTKHCLPTYLTYNMRKCVKCIILFDQSALNIILYNYSAVYCYCSYEHRAILHSYKGLVDFIVYRKTIKKTPSNKRFDCK